MMVLPQFLVLVTPFNPTRAVFAILFGVFTVLVVNVSLVCLFASCF